MSQAVATFKGDMVYLDTMIPYALLRNIEIAAVKALFQRIHTGELQAFTSVLTFDELAYRLLLAVIRDNQPGNPLDHLRRDEANLIATYYPAVAVEVQRLQTLPNLVLLDLTAADINLMHQLAQQHRLRPRDALHLTAMHKCGCFNLVSQDSDFDHVPYVQRFTL
jgi:predicted nucleic acid-binding protein